MKKTKLLALLLGSLTVCALAGTMAGCRNKDEDKTDEPITQTPTEENKDITYKPGDVIVDEKDVEYTKQEDGYEIKYSEKKIDVKYLSGNSSYVTLTGSDRTDMQVTGYSGELQELSLKEIEKKVKVNNAPISVSKIADGAFADCVTLEKVDLSKQNSALSFEIGNYAFSNCTNVASVTFPDKVYVEYNKVGGGAFYNNISLQEVSLGEKFTVFGRGVFENCVSLTAVTLPQKLTGISAYMFSGCESLQTITLPEGVKTIEGSAFKSTALTAVPFESVKDLRYIGDSAFENTRITSITVPDSVSYIGNKAFYDCANLASVTVPFIGQDITTPASYNSGNPSYMFINRYGMPSQSDAMENDDDEAEEELTGRSLNVTVTKANGVPAGAFAFANDVKNINVTFATKGKYKVYNVDGETFTTKDVTVSKTMGGAAFYRCSALTGVTLPAMDNIAEMAFGDCKALTTVTVPQIKIIDESAFRNCKALAKYIVPATVKTIGDSAFRGCTALSSVEIPQNVGEIGNYAFRNSGLTSFDVKFDVKYGSSILADCTKLATLNFDKFDDYTTVKQGEDTVTMYKALSLNSLFATGSDLELDRYSESSRPLYQRNEGVNSYGRYWIPKTLNKITVASICQTPTGFLRGLNSLTEISLGFVEYLRDGYSYDSEYRYAKVSDNAFTGCSKLATLTVTNGNYVKSIGTSAFEGCTVLPDSVLDSFNKVESIGSYAFSGCKAFRNVTIPASVLSSSNTNTNGLGGNVFYNCYGITSLTVEKYSTQYNYNQVTSLGSVKNMFGSDEDSYYDETYNDYSNGVPKTLKTVELNGVISLESNALENMKHITAVEINFAADDDYYSGSYSIGNSAFKNCTSLKTVDVNFAETKNGYTHNYAIYGSAFAGCTGLEEVLTDTTDLPVQFSSNVFTNCYNLTTMEIPVSVYVNSSTIYGVFYNMEYTNNDYYPYETYSPKLKEITVMLPENLDTYYLGRLFSNSYSTTSNSYVPSSLKTVNLVAEPASSGSDEESATFRIPAYMFSGCSNLTSVVFGTEVTSIGQNAFYECYNLTGRTNPNGTNVYVYRNWVVGNTASGTGSNIKYIVPATVVGIANNAIGSYSNPNVYFLGSETAWENVILPDTYTGPNVYYYSEKAPVTYGAYWQYDETSYYNNTPVLWVYDQQEYTLDGNGGIFNNDEYQITYSVTPSGYNNINGNTSYELREGSLRTPTREGYYFAGWYTDAACTKEVSFPYYSATQTTLYAKWVTYQITYNSYVTEEDGVYTGSTSSSYTSNDLYIYINAASAITVQFDYNMIGYNGELYIYSNTDGSSSNYYDYGSTYSDYKTTNAFSVEAGDRLVIRYHSTSSYSTATLTVENIVVTDVVPVE